MSPRENVLLLYVFRPKSRDVAAALAPLALELASVAHSQVPARSQKRLEEGHFWDGELAVQGCSCCRWICQVVFSNIHLSNTEHQTGADASPGRRAPSHRALQAGPAVLTPSSF